MVSCPQGFGTYVTFARPDFGLAALRLAAALEPTPLLAVFFFGMHKYLWRCHVQPLCGGDTEAAPDTSGGGEGVSAQPGMIGFLLAGIIGLWMIATIFVQDRRSRKRKGKS